MNRKLRACMYVCMHVLRESIVRLSPWMGENVTNNSVIILITQEVQSFPELRGEMNWIEFVSCIRCC